MRAQMQEAHDPGQITSQTAQGDANPVACAGHMDVEGRLAEPPQRNQREYGGLFSAEERARGLPEELMRLARRHGCVRDRVQRRDGNGGTRMQRIALRAVHDDAGRLSGFLESIESFD